MAGVTETRRVERPHRIRRALANLAYWAARQIAGEKAKPEDRHLAAPAFRPSEEPRITAGDGIEVRSHDARVALQAQMGRQMMRFDDPLALEKEIGAKVLPKIFPSPRLKVRGVKFLGMDTLSMDIQLNPAQPRTSTIDRLIKGCFSDVTGGIIAKAVQTKDVVDDPNYIALPFMMENNLCGLAVISGRITQEDIGMAHLVRDAVNDALANTVELARKNIKIITDGLTGLYNGDHLRASLKGEVIRATRSKNKVSLSLIRFDIDTFKAVNDTYGKDAGDDVLKAVAFTIKKNIRESMDIACRDGGGADEFNAVLPETSLSDAVALGERIRQQVQALEIETIDRDSRPIKVRVTVSVGVANLPYHVGMPQRGKADEAAVLLRSAADKAVYAAKGLVDGAPVGDRNRVAVNINGNWMLADEAINHFKKQEKKEGPVSPEVVKGLRGG